MRRQGHLIGMMAALALGAGMPGVATVAVGAPVSMSVPSGTVNGPAVGGGVYAGRRAVRFIGLGGADGFGWQRPTYKKWPARTVAQDKRDARKARNRQRNKR